jgi:hypothetical protein
MHSGATDRDHFSGAESPMLDVVFVCAVLIFFAVGALFVQACDRL